MSSNIQNEVVRLKFDNSLFEQKLGATLKSLGRLRDSLSFGKKGTGLDNLNKAAQDVDLSPVTAQTEKVGAGFVALATIGITALARLTNAAIDMGLNVAKALTITPVTDGFAEYELKMGSIQTIMAGTGESLETVNGYLEELNAYSDRTIYSFADMTQNIGKFTNAGVSLDAAVGAIQGVANVAALAGSNSQQASNAMYNFSQALATGSVKLIDWKSIENAGLATVSFKEQLLEGAVAAGTLTKEADGTYKTIDGKLVDTMANFNSTLQEGWLSSEALVTTLQVYSDETTEIGQAAADAATDIKTFSQAVDTIKESVGSGWAQSAEIFFGDFEESKALWTEFEGAVSGAMGQLAEERNTLLKQWKAFGGRESLFQGIRNAAEALASWLLPIRDAFREVFPKKTFADLLVMTRRFEAFTEKLILGEGSAGKLKLTFQGLFAIVKIGVEVVKGLWRVFTGVLGIFTGASAGGLLTFTAKIGEFFVELEKQLVSGGGLVNFFENIAAAITGFFGAMDFSGYTNTLKKAFGVVRDFFGEISVSGDVLSWPIEQLGKLRDLIRDLFTKDAVSPEKVTKSVKKAAEPFTLFADAVERVKEVLAAVWAEAKKIVEPFKAVGRVLGDVTGAIGEFLGDFWGKITDSFSTGNADQIIKLFEVGFLGGLVAVLAKFLKDGVSLDIGNGFLSKLGDGFQDVLKGVTGNLTAMQQSIKADMLLKIAMAIGVLALSLGLLALIDAKALAKALTATTVGIGQLAGAMFLLTKMEVGPKMGAKILLVAAAMGVLAISMLAFSIAMRSMAKLDLGEIATGFAGITAGLILLDQAMRHMTRDTEGIFKAALAMGALSVSLLLLSVAVRSMGSMEWQTMVTGLAGIGAGLLILVTAMNKMPTEKALSAAVSIGVLSVSLMLLTASIKLMSLLDPVTTAKGLLGIAAALAVVVVAMNTLDKSELISSAIALGILSVAINMMARGVKKMGDIDWQTMAKGIVGLGITLKLLTLAMKAVKTKITGALALLLIATSLGKMVDVLQVIATVPWSVILKGMLALSLVIGVLAGAAFLLQAATPIMLMFGAAIVLIGAGFALFGVAAAQVARAIQILSTTGRQGLEFFMDAVDRMLKKLPEIAAAAGKAAIAFVASFVEGTDELIGIVVDLLDVVLNVIVEKAPDIVDAGVTLITELLGGIREIFPDIVQTGLDMLIALLEGIGNNLQEVTAAAISVITAFIKSIGDSARSIIEAGTEMIINIIEGITDATNDIITAGADAIISFLEGVASNMVKVVDAGFRIVIEMLNGLADSIRQNRGDLMAAGIDILDAIFGGVIQKSLDVMAWFLDFPLKILGWIGDIYGTLQGVGIDIIQGVMDGIARRITNLWLWATGLPGKLISWVGSVFSKFSEVGKDIVRGIWDGIQSLADWIRQKVTGWVGSILPGFVKKALGIHSPSTVFAYFGRMMVMGLGVGLEEAAPRVNRQAAKVARQVGESMVPDTGQLTSNLRAALERANATIESAESRPTIRPVLDLTDIQAGMRQIGQQTPKSRITLDFSDAGATAIAEQMFQDSQVAPSDSDVGGGDLHFEQHIHSPRALRTADIYRQTRSQVALAKKEIQGA